VSHAEGVYFGQNDYAGFWRRLLVDTIDVLVVCGAWLLCGLLWETVLGTAGVGLLLAGCFIFAFGYFVPLKRSAIRTLGYRIGRVRIVGLDGRPASIPALSLRFMFAVFGPLNWLDLIWRGGDWHRQALRDKFTNTYVVKINAVPAGAGPLVYSYYEVSGYSFLFREVDTRPVAAAAAVPEPSLHR
jgi:uncharacterized RDD family membrane protein YckC